MGAKRSAGGCVKKFGGKDNLLLILTIVGVVLGLCLGCALKFGLDPGLNARQVSYLKFPGDLFVRMLKCLILPLIASSIINSIASMDGKTASRSGLIAVAYYFTTTALAVITGIVLVVSIRPGDGTPLKDVGAGQENKCPGITAGDTVMDLIRNMLPANLVEMTIRSYRTCFDYQYKNATGNKVTISPSEAERWLKDTTLSKTLDLIPKSISGESLNILGLVVMSIVFGVVLGVYKKHCRALIEVIKALEYAVLKLVTIVIWYSPIGIMFLIAASICKMDDMVAEMQRLGLYMATVLAGLGIHAFFTLPLLLFFIGKRNPFKFIINMMQALLTALGTASSSATMPLTMKCLEEKVGVHPTVTGFVIPLGATINMDGTALYEAVAAIYIAQVINVKMGAGKILITSLTATLASIGAAGIPSAGLVTMIMVLISVDLPPHLFALIVPVDWFLDRIRTTVNVWGDSIGAVIVHRFVGHHLDVGTPGFAEVDKGGDDVEGGTNSTPVSTNGITISAHDSDSADEVTVNGR